MATVLMVDDEEDLRWSMVRHCLRERPDLQFLDTGDPREALKTIRDGEIDVLITDFKMPHMSGLDLLLEARKLQPDLRAIFITAFGTPELKREIASRGAIEFLEKPFTAGDLFEAVSRALARAESGFTGSVQLTLMDLLQLYGFNQATGRLHMKLKKRAGSLWFASGRIVHAECGKLRGPEAVFELLRWTGGTFDMEANAKAPVISMDASCDELLLEAFRLQDEAAQTLPPDQTPAPPIAGGAPDADPSTPRPPSGRISLRSEVMANVKETLGKMSEIDGFIAGCLVDADSGMVLGTVGGGPQFNIEVAAAGNTEVVRAKRKAAKAIGLADRIDDILITLTKQYHIIRPLSSNDGLFLYLALDRTKSNLALARAGLQSLETTLQVA